MLFLDVLFTYFVLLVLCLYDFVRPHWGYHLGPYDSPCYACLKEFTETNK